MALFMSYSWPGNVRELKSALEYAFVIAESGLIDTPQLPPQIWGKKRARGLDPGSTNHENPSERAALIEALKQSNGNQSQAARILGVSRVTVWNRMRKYGIDLQKVMMH